MTTRTRSIAAAFTLVCGVALLAGSAGAASGLPTGKRQHKSIGVAQGVSATTLSRASDLGGTPPPTAPRGPRVQFATSSLQCNGTKYEVSTGNGKGKCETSFVNGKPVSVECSDKKGNRAAVYCDKGTAGVCGSTEGSGSCKIK